MTYDLPISPPTPRDPIHRLQVVQLPVVQHESMRPQHPGRLLRLGQTARLLDGEPVADRQRDALHLCLLYTSDAADERSSVDPGGGRIIKKKNTYSAINYTRPHTKA